MTKKVFIAVALTFTLTACATVRTSMTAGAQSPSVRNNYQGVLHVELGGLSDARPYMIRECQSYGG